MKTQLRKIVLSLSMFVLALTVSGAERWETLRAINWIENPTNQTKVGKFGELGPYQFRPGTWRMHTTKPFQLAVKRAVADEIAVKHYEWLKRTLADSGIEPSAFNIAMAWNCGVNAVIQGRVPTVSYRYAQRVTNLIESFQAARPELVEQEKPAQPDWQAAPANVLEQQDGLRFRVLLDTPRFVIAG